MFKIYLCIYVKYHQKQTYFLSVNNTEEMDPFVISSSINKVFTKIANKKKKRTLHCPLYDSLYQRPFPDL